MKIIKKGENNATKSKPMGTNELSDDDLEGVGGGYEYTWNIDNSVYDISGRDAMILYEKTGHWIIGRRTTSELAKILGCKDGHKYVTRKLASLGVIDDGMG